MDQGVLPEVWKQASVVPVFKKGNPAISDRFHSLVSVPRY